VSRLKRHDGTATRSLAPPEGGQMVMRFSRRSTHWSSAPAGRRKFARAGRATFTRIE